MDVIIDFSDDLVVISGDDVIGDGEKDVDLSKKVACSFSEKTTVFSGGERGKDVEVVQAM